MNDEASLPGECGRPFFTTDVVILGTLCSGAERSHVVIPRRAQPSHTALSVRERAIVDGPEAEIAKPSREKWRAEGLALVRFFLSTTDDWKSQASRRQSRCSGSGKERNALRRMINM